jgi:phosphoglycerate kinase
MTILKMTDVDLNNKRVLIREDLNVPVENGQVTNDARILAALPTIEYILERNGRVMVMSHLGRPTEGKYEEQFSLAPLVEPLTELLGHPVRLAKDWLLDERAIPRSGEVVLLENVRFNVGEKSNDKTLSRKMASMCDVFVMDAFATAHRAEASTCGIVEFANFACAGPLLLAEIDALQRAMQKPLHPVAAIVGGSKVSTKITVLSSLINIVDQLIVGGGIANTFIAACGHSVGRSLYEPELIPQAQKLMQQAKEKGAAIPIPIDVVVAKDFSSSSVPRMKSSHHLADVV